ncbi:SET and MYND domain-containing protein 3 [Branchiostoma belcheri]|nr:SET and MYND domain-containing protein 3 [Branchiostoma belcheri]
MDREVVELFSEPGKGKGVRARAAGRGIRQGSLIFAEDAYIFTLDLEESKRRCHFCLQKKTVPLVCYGCKYARYCSEKCQEHDQQHHMMECDVINLISGLASNLKMVVAALCKMHHLAVERGQLSSISNLMSHVDDIKRQRAGGLAAMMSTLHTTLKFHLDYLIDQESLEKVIGKVMCNSFAILDDDHQQIGTALYAQASMINHSCTPNCVPVFIGSRIEIRAARVILPGEEATISYTDTLTPTQERKDHLSFNYFFICQCEACNNKERDAKMECLKCPRCSRQIPKTSALQLLACSCGYKLTSGDFLTDMEDIKNFAENLLQQEVFHDDNVTFVSVLERALDVCVEMEEWQNALEYAERLERILRVYLQNDIGLGLLYKKKGVIQLQLGRTADAKQSLLTAKRLLTVTHGWRHDLVQHIRNLLTDLEPDDETTLDHENDFSNL